MPGAWTALARLQNHIMHCEESDPYARLAAVLCVQGAAEARMDNKRGKTARAWFLSRWGQVCLTLAGLDITEDWALVPRGAGIWLDDARRGSGLHKIGDISV